jgi:transforming growth factor-beta-induced protein
MRKLVLCIALALGVTGCSDNDKQAVVEAPPIAVEKTTIFDAASTNDAFETLTAALKATGLDSVLDDESKTFTVFAPTDDAFALLGEATINELLTQPEQLSSILTYHVLEGKVNSEAALSAVGSTVATVNGNKIALSTNGSSLQINTATVVTTDLMTDNGIIHVIDAVLLPPTASEPATDSLLETARAAGQFTVLLDLLAATGLDTVLADESNQFTVFAPNDEAFAKIDAATLKVLSNNPDTLKSILLQHVLPTAVDSITAMSLAGQSADTANQSTIPVSINTDSDSLMVGNANVVAADIQARNGVIHVIDAVIIGDIAIPQALGSITDVARENGNFTTLLAALEAANLTDVLADIKTDYTVFAPTDAAFALLGEATINGLLQDPEALTDILLYHVIGNSKIMSSTAVSVASSNAPNVTMANNKTTILSLKDQALYINGAKVVIADVLADNGVIHVIDAVILPSN